ncbi:MAG: hypothetical protein QHH13_10505, partial [Melioribacter sp.]|nr:hypothetical protein [Melioribacter sp.]
LFLVFYLIMINILSLSIFKEVNTSELSFVKIHKLNSILTDEKIISTEIEYLFLINLSDINCMNCVMTIDTFINILSENENLASRTLVLVTHPDKIFGERRCIGWIKNQPQNIKIKYIDFKKIKETNIFNSILLIYEGGRINSYYTLPFNPTKILIK